MGYTSAESANLVITHMDLLAVLCLPILPLLAVALLPAPMLAANKAGLPNFYRTEKATHTLKRRRENAFPTYAMAWRPQAGHGVVAGRQRKTTDQREPLLHTAVVVGKNLQRCILHLTKKGYGAGYLR